MTTELKNVINALLDDAIPSYSLMPELKMLEEILLSFSNIDLHFQGGLQTGETHTQEGLAVSPTVAAMCLNESARTTQFMRSLHRAIRDLRHDRQPVKVLYAGTGPYALLALPSLLRYSADEVAFALLDIHQESLDSVKQIIQALGVEKSITNYDCADAIRYQIDNTPDIIISETMNYALMKEPQVAIFRNLSMQAPEALLIPESVQVDIKLINMSKEHIMMPADHTGDFPEPERDRIEPGPVNTI